MRELERYKNLAAEDKNNLTKYFIYNNIFEVARNENVDLKDAVVDDIKDLSYDLYIVDDYYDLSINEIAFFLTECYVNDYDFLNKIEDIDYNDILQAISDRDYDFYKEKELER